jgi:hypothetical protein
MDGSVESWSQPWHALQRSLAAEFQTRRGAETAVSVAGHLQATLKAVVPLSAIQPTGSWLVRGRNPAGRRVNQREVTTAK